MSYKFHFSPRENKAHEINWREWGLAAFEEAKAKDKLILLSISATWCHWCHVMDETSYSYNPNINIINDEFIPIRVDSDKQPDINRRFNMGGWPTTAILTNNGALLNGGTYMPDKVLYSFLTNTNKYYKINKSNIIFNQQKNEKNQIKIKKDNELSNEVLNDIESSIYLNFDAQYGGFGTQTKFPNTDTLDYLINKYYNSKNDNMFEIVTKTLNFMSDGGIYDRQQGGFFRYSTTRDWSIPHYEKMLEDNSKLLDIYLKVFQITKDEKYLNISKGIIQYLNENLLDEQNGTFFGSQDADEQYYRLDKEQRKNKQAPYIDKTIYTNWNALAISSYVRAYYILNDKKYLEIAQKNMSFLMSNCLDEKIGMHHYYSKDAKTTGILEDQIYVINALIDLYEVTFDIKYINYVNKLANIIINNFYDKESQGFYDDVSNYEYASIVTSEKSIETNSVCMQTFYRLFDYTNIEIYKKVAQKTLHLFNEVYEQYSYFASIYGKAILRHLNDAVKISIVGDFKEQKTNDMVFDTLKMYIPFKVIEGLDINKDKDKIELKGYAYNESPVGYICKGNVCLNPAFSSKDLNTIFENSQMQ